MIALMLVASMAGATPESDLRERLLGDPQPYAVATETEVDVPWWPIPASILGLGLLWTVRRQLAAKTSQASQGITVISRTALDNAGSLSVVEVHDAVGNTRRLLVGTGAGGAPTLVADLGAAARPFEQHLDEQQSSLPESSDALIDSMLRLGNFRGEA